MARIKDGAKTATGGTVKSAVYETDYDILETKGDTVTVGFKTGNIKVATFKSADVIKDTKPEKSDKA